MSGLNILGRTNIFYAYYDEASGLQNASAVTIRGVKVGQVIGLEVDPDDMTQVKVTFSVESCYNLPKNTVAKIVSTGIISGKALSLAIGDSEEILENGDVLVGEIQPDMLDSAGEVLMDLKTKVDTLIANLNTTLTSVNSLLDKNEKNVTDAVAHLESILKKADRSTIISDVNKFTATLGESSADIREAITSVKGIVDQLNSGEVGLKLTKSLDALYKTLDAVSQGEGSVGKLLNDKELYDNLNDASSNLSKLLFDIKENPRRYINVSVFGGKDKSEKLKEKALKAKIKEELKAAKKAAKTQEEVVR